MTIRNRQADKHKSESAEVIAAYPCGTRLKHLRNGKIYQIGVKHGSKQFWMFCEPDAERGLVNAAVILMDFERLKEV